MGRELQGLHVGDGIGILDVVSRALEQLEADEAVEMAYTAVDDEVDSDHFDDPNNPEYSRNDDVDAGPLASSDLMTAEQVHNAASSTRRSGAAVNGEQIEMSSAQEAFGSEAHQNVDLGPRQRKRLGLRRRKTDLPAGNPAQSEAEGMALYGTKATVPFSNSIANYFKTVGSTHEKRITALTAWGVSVIGLIVCLVFVTKDFISSKSEAMVAVRFSIEDVVQLPELFICSTQRAFPVAWKHGGSEKLGDYGLPTQWVEILKMPGNDTEYIRYPDTHSHPNIESVVVDRFGNSCENRSFHLADAKRFHDAYSDVPHCFPCVKIKSDPAVPVTRALVNRHLEDSEKSSLSIQVAQSRTVDACGSPRAGLLLSVKVDLMKMVVARAAELQRLGVVDFNGEDPTRLREPDDREALAYEYAYVYNILASFSAKGWLETRADILAQVPLKLRP